MIEVIKSGLYSTIQDLGRFGFENYGVPISGSMDQFSSIISNKLLGNKDQDAVMEITMTGPVLKFLEKTKISITGADISPSINNNPVKLNVVHDINKGDLLSFGKLKYGIRSYLSVSGGFSTKEVMGSKSMYPNITK
jgi:allophanate hydrolase subunit 2